MILQYFKTKENEYKIIADNIYIYILAKSKELIGKDFFKEVNFNSSFEIISILLIFYLKVLKDTKIKKNTNISNLLIKNLIEDLDNTMREIGIGDMSIGKHVKKYVKKFYFRIKIIDPIINDCDEIKLAQFLNSLKSINVNCTNNMSLILIDIYKEIKKNKGII